MRLLRSLLLSALSTPLALALAFAAADPLPSPNDATPFDFQELLAVLPAESLHAALHKHAESFQDGIFEHDREAVEKVHHEDPGMATKVLAEAALHLIKRQSNGTVSSTTPAGSTTAVTSNTPVVVPVVIPTTNAQGQSTILTTSALATPTESIVSQITTTNAQGSTVVQSTTLPAAVITAANGQLTTTPVSPLAITPTDVTTTDARGATIVLSSATPGKVFTATDAQGSTFVTTYTPGGGSVSSLVLQTSILPNGQATTITSFAVVGPLATGTAVSSSSSPKLQSASSALRPRGHVAAAVVLGVALVVGVFAV